MRARAYGKVNLALEVGARTGTLHSVRAISQSISWHDEIDLEPHDEDAIDVPGGGAPADSDNLAWRALHQVRELAGTTRPFRMVLRKHLPAGAGLGGGSADAAAVVALASRHLGLDPSVADPLLLGLGSDVPFAMLGGTALVTGVGDVVQPLPSISGFAFAIVVPPFAISTPGAYARWDDLGEPRGPAVAASALPPALRNLAPLRNDLYSAAVSLVPAVDDWRSELEQIWGVPVSMTGSGSALYGFFPTDDEAADAVRSSPHEARASHAATPRSTGWSLGPPFDQFPE